MKVKSFRRGVDNVDGAEDEVDKKKNTYVFTYDVFYDKDGSVEDEATGVTATLDYDIKAQMKAKKFGEFAQPK